jgi:N-acetylmuramoyl-L-alanine amidase
MHEITDCLSPNFDEREGESISMLVLHYTGMADAASAIARLCDPEAKVSCHYLVDEQGRVLRMVPEEKRAWHAGRSFWRGIQEVNAHSIGIEIVNPGHEFGYRPFPERQVAAVIDLVADIRSRWEVADDRIVGHSDIAPTRKDDPGELFPWKRLAEAGHGLWVEPDAAPGAPLGEGEEGAGVFALQAGFTRLGYDCAPSGKFDAHTTAVVRAFQRHWRQEKVDGIADGMTRARLIALLRAAA